MGNKTKELTEIFILTKFLENLLVLPFKFILTSFGPT
jgi:hypothetical protein